VPSKTSLLRDVKALDVDGARAALAEAPELLEVRDDRGRTWLHVVCSIDMTSRKKKDVAATVAIADVLLSLGLGIDAPAFTEGAWHATPVWYAIARGRNLELARFLLERGASPEHTLWAAAFNEDLDAIQLLAEQGATIDAVVENETPFLGAIKTSRFPSAWLLVDLGADVDFVDPKGMTALHYMLNKGSDAEHLEEIVRRGADLDIAGPSGKTAREVLGRKRDVALKALAARGK
jgi:ankyrin repeat protein